MIQSFSGLTPQVHPDAWVHETACVIGEVRLDAGVNIWPTAVLRGDMGQIWIGENSNIQDGAVAHATGGISQTRIGQRVTVGHRAILHGCIVEDDCLIGMGSIVMDNAVIGAGSMVGAGAVVLAGRIIPPGSMVLGSPGKVVRPLNDGERAWIDGSWRIYCERARQWRE